MSRSLTDNGQAGQGWRLLVEIVQPPVWQDEHWVNAGLAAALDAIHLPAADEERLENAMVEVVAHVRRCQSTLDTVPRLVVVRVLVSEPAEAGTAPYCWGFFIIEKVAGPMDATDADADRVEGRPGAYVIELCLYADAASA